MKNKKGLALFSLFFMTFIWGTSFVIMKNTLNSISTLYLLAIRFSGAAVIMLLASVKELKKLDMGYIKGGAIMGVFLLTAYIFQTYGLKFTTAGKNAFLTATYCVLVPFIYWVYLKRRPDKFNIIAAAMCIVGIALISLGNDLSIGIGDVLTLICGVFFALHIIATDKAVQNRSTLLITMVQFATAGIIAWIAALIFEPFPKAIPTDATWSIVYLTVMCTALCFFLQIFGQKYTSPSQAAIIMTLESVFGAIISVATGNDTLTVRLFFGFLLTFLAVFISETKLNFLRKGKAKTAENQ